MNQIPPEVLFAITVFGAVFLASLGVSAYMTRSVRLRRRLQSGTLTYHGLQEEKAGSIRQFLRDNFDERYLNIAPTAKEEQRKMLIRAGYFSSEAVWKYFAIRAIIMIVLPVIAFTYSAVALPDGGLTVQLSAAGLAFLLAWALPSAYVSRRQQWMQEEYRTTFPDMMDWFIVCVNAGLSLEAAIDRISTEVADLSPGLGLNLALVTAELRAGRDTISALDGFAERVGIEEAASFVTLLRQSLELGTSVSQTLRVYGEEMRDKRMMRAEERAAKLPVKVVLPLGGFIFPVILIIVLLPVIIRMSSGGLTGAQ
jgi:tight adherence protein C